MQNTIFAITVTSPFVDTASGFTDGELFDGEFSRSLESKNIGLVKTMISDQDNDKIKELRGDILAVEFKFSVSKSLINSLCEDIADHIFHHRSFSPKQRILVEGAKGSSVISLSGLSPKALGETIKQIVTNV
jgi:hypothetical protein